MIKAWYNILSINYKQLDINLNIICKLKIFYFREIYYILQFYYSE